MPTHHRANKAGYVFEHILVAEEKYGRPIVNGEIIHHLDHNKKNNDPDNLVICPNQTVHRLFHTKRLKVRIKKMMDAWDKCLAELDEVLEENDEES